MTPTDYPAYTVAIRTLGRAGEKYQRLLNSLKAQTLPPQAILVYLAEGYPIPQETCGLEQYIYVPKGMVRQRALPYAEVTTEWILFADDDIELPSDGVERLFQLLHDFQADVIAPDFFAHTGLSWKAKLAMALLLSAVPDYSSRLKGYCVNLLGAYNYNPYPSTKVGISTTNAGCGFLARKRDFLNIHSEQDLWLDEVHYPAMEDQVMFYKMHLAGLKLLTLYHSGWKHLDAQTAISPAATAQRLYSGARNQVIFRELYVTPYLSAPQRFVNFVISLYRTVAEFIYRICKAIIHRQSCYLTAPYRGKRDGKHRLQELLAERATM